MPLKKKFTGATARLFAKICEHYITAAEDECNDAPEEVPLFSYLSPQQRLSLVKDVMIGALCEDEPMFPDTIQHNAAYLGLIYVLHAEIDVEIDEECDYPVGDDFIDEGERQAKLLGSSNVRSSRASSSDPMLDFQTKLNLIEDRAEKNKKKIEELGDDVGEFKPAAKAPDIDNARNFFGKMEDLCIGGPISQRQRDNIRPLEEDEEYAYRWRLLCDAAFQEDTGISLPFPLSQVNFDFRCSRSYKWIQALNILLVSKCFDIPDKKESALVYCGEIDHNTYADPDKFPLIREIDRHVDVLRKVYEKKWNPDRRSYDQRCIYAVASHQIFYGFAQRDWLDAFLQKCSEQNIDIRRDSNYQKRLEIFRDMAEEFPEGLRIPWNTFENCVDGALERWQPSKFVSNAYDPSLRHCSGPEYKREGWNMSMPCYNTENLQACSLCKVVLYCSKECQKRHWKEHKLVCKQLAATRKDKDQVAKMAKNN